MAIKVNQPVVPPQPSAETAPAAWRPGQVLGGQKGQEVEILVSRFDRDAAPKAPDAGMSRPAFGGSIITRVPPRPRS